MPPEAEFSKFKIASNHYNHVEEDIGLYGEMGFSAYRFTIAWSRIFPNGNDPEPNEEGLAFYEKILDECETYDIAPVVTLYAYDLPLHLLKTYNGWMSRQCVEDYLKYVETVVKRFKGRVKYWTPFNEQNFIILDSEYMTGCKAQNAKEIFQLEHHINMAYARATTLIHQIDPDAKVTGNIGTTCLYPKTCNPLDVEACDTLMFRIFYNYADIYFRGEYTKRYMKNVANYDITDILLDGDLEIIKSAEPDALTTTYYFSSGITPEHLDVGQSMNGLKAGNPYCDANEWGWSIDPYGFKHYITEIYHRYQLPILILENGLGHRDYVETDGKINDDYRIDYLAKHIDRMAEAISDGVEMLGYLTWSATDLYSTREGFEKRYGFVYVDQNDDLKRKKKKSFYWYKKVISSNGEDLLNNVEY